MSDRDKARLVYSTDVGRICPGCERPVQDCRFGVRAAPPEASPVAGRLVAKLRLEKKGRGGKSVTVIAGLPRQGTLLQDLSRELKRACGTGGAIIEDTIELQGDLRERVREYLRDKHIIVKG